MAEGEGFTITSLDYIKKWESVESVVVEPKNEKEGLLEIIEEKTK